jgi:CHC2 zinc finger
MKVEIKDAAMGLKTPITSPLETTATGSRLDWSDVRDRVDLGIIATALLGVSPGRRGERGRRRWWACPFHQDSNPSFCVTPGTPWWRCYGCGEHGDAAALVMRLQGVTFPEAVRWLAEQSGHTGTFKTNPHPLEAVRLLGELRQKKWPPHVLRFLAI